MLNRILFIFFLLTVLLQLSFVIDDPFFKITKKDVVLKIPKGFPKPNYSFSENTITPEGFVLGRKLFYDTILSLDNSVSCGTCHQQYAAFAHIDHSLSHGIKDRIGTRNVSALQNLIWNKNFMWDGGINHIEVQPIAPITNKVEMAETMEGIIAKLSIRPDYKKAFFDAFNDSTITTERIMKSLTQFMGLMISSNSRYDKYIAGKEKFTQAEKNGLDLFRSKCATCHKEPLFTDHSFRNNGITPNPMLNDKGRAIITANETDKYKFKVPSLRNVELTYPYMHDGRFRNLNEVINHYAGSSKFSVGADEPILQIGTLNKEQIQDLQSFLLTLTDKTFIYDRRFADPNFKR
ncbi:MAG: cytochrome-c peroxidase [Crocinitomicaceae bacterium]